MNNFWYMLKKLGIWRRYIFLLVLRAPFDGCRAWMLANLMKTTFRCIAEKDADKLLGKCLLYGLICGALFFYNGTVWSIYAAFAAKIEAMLQKKLFQKVLGKSFGEIEGKHGEWITRLNSDIHGAFMLMNGPLNIPHAMVASVNLLLSVLLLCRSSIPIFVLTLIFMLPHMVLHYKLVLTHLPRLKEESQKQLAENTATIVPLISEAEVIWIYRAENLMMQSCEKSSRQLLKTNMMIQIRKTLGETMIRLLGITGYLVILLVAGGSISGGDMQFADLTYALQVRVALLGAMMMLVSCMNNMKSNGVCVKRIRDIL